MLKKYILLTPILASLLFNSCSDDDFGNSAVQPVTFTTKVTFDSDFDASKLPVNAKTILKNIQTGMTNEVIYADGLIFGQLFGANTVESQPYSQANGQLDWSKGEGNTKGAEANTGYVYVANAVRIPGNGTTYPVQPGQSITIAQTAINHKGNYTDANGKVIEILKPELTVDLSNADFEVNMTSYLGSQYSYDIQNPAVPDLDIVWWANGNKDLLFDNLGRQAYILFRADENDINGFGKVNPSNKTTYQYLQLPNYFILDAVETTQDMGTKLVPKKLQNKQDAGYVYLTAGSYTSTSIIRKTQKTINGRIILKDTNNSTNDFVNIKAEPKIFAQ